MRKSIYILVAIFMAATMVLTSCGPAATTVAPATSVPGTTAVPPTAVPTQSVADIAGSLPRNQTLYFNGLQWGSVVCWNPYSSNCNNAMALASGDSARVPMFETPYIFDMLDGKSYPLLADGPWAWNTAGTDITFKIKATAHWSDGTPVTADDVAYTWATHVKYKDGVGVANSLFIDTITAVDAQTVDVKAKLDASGKPINPLIVAQYLDANYVLQKAWTQTLEARSADATALMADTAMDVVYSGPYHYFFADDSKVIMVRDDNYWGADASMWGKLPVPKYLAHTIFKDNASGSIALAQGEVDVSQQFNSNIQILWLNYGLPISTYLPEAPYMIAASLPTAYYNLASPGLDQVEVRKAIAMAVDYPTIIANAMTNQSPTFDQVPRSLMNPTPGEQALYDKAAIAALNLQWAGNDIAGANKLLDDAGIKDTNGDGNREYKGTELHYVATCPNGWSDWQAAIEQVAAAGKKIGIDIVTNYPEWAVYQTVVTNWPLAEGYDILMMWSDGAGPTQPWGRVNHLMNSMYAQTANNWNGNWGGYKNPDADAIINAIPAETDPAKLKADYTELVKIYLTDIPSFTLMYRPDLFQTVNETVWTGFPNQTDGTNPPVPPMVLINGYSIAGLYNLTLVNP